MRVTLLGCGNSTGVPVIGCHCPVCQSTNPKNTRLRVSVHIEINNLSIVIDTSPDFRQQILLNKINKIDAVLYTHDHADHTHGIDDLRPFNYVQNSDIAVYGARQTLESLQNRFVYAFLPRPPEGAMFRPSLVPQVIEMGGNSAQCFNVQDIEITAFEQQHGKFTTLGYRIGDFAYSTDVDHLPESAFAALEGVKYWVVDCLRYTPSYSHSHLERTLEWIKRVQPEKAILTHMAHELEYDALAAQLPPGVVPGYDGLTLTIGI